MPLDLLLINPSGREAIYQDLAHEFAAVEPPLWCRLLAGYCRARDWSVAILDAEAEGLGPEAIATRVALAAPLLVCIVAYGHQPSASTQTMTGASAAARRIKAMLPDQKILIVGGHVAALPERTLREEAVDFACSGEGPKTVDGLLCHLEHGRTALADVPGLAWREKPGVKGGGAISMSPPAALIADLDELCGDTWDLLPMPRYRAHNWQCFGDPHLNSGGARQPYASIYTSLGCPYRCSFCCINAPFGVNRYRMRRPATVVAEIDHLYKRYGVRTFKIADEMFVLNARHVYEICERLADRLYADELNIWAYARVDTIKDHDQLARLRRAGVRWLALGIESGSAHVRDGASKQFSEADIFAVVRAIQAAGINVLGNFIFGLPDDTMQTMQATLDLAKALNLEFANFYSAMAYPGSPLYEIAVGKAAMLPDAWSGYSQHSYDCTPLPTATLTSAEVLAFRDRAFHEYFAHPPYLELVERKFGCDTRSHVEAMAAHRLPRKLTDAALVSVPA